MKRIILYIFILFCLCIHAEAAEFTAPAVPQTAQSYMPAETESFGQGLWEILKYSISKIQPAFQDAAASCLSVIAVTILLGLVQLVTQMRLPLIRLIGTVSISALFFKPTHALIGLGAQTVEELYEYGKLLLPVMTSALAAQGGITSSAVLYTGSALFCTLLSGMVSKCLVPMLYVYLCISIAYNAMEEPILQKLQNGIKWLMTWGLKMILYVFTGYLTVTGIVGGTADASAVKAAKLAITGMVPVVGGIVSDASETILVSVGIMKNSAGIYGMLAMIAIWIGPFIKIGCQYLLTKLTWAICSASDSSTSSGLAGDYAGAMGIVLAMTGAVCLFLLISTICFMKGVA